MAIFKVQNKNLSELRSKAFLTERELQELNSYIFDIIKQTYQSPPDL